MVPITTSTVQCCVLIVAYAAVMIQGATSVSGCCDLAFLRESEIVAAGIFLVLLLDNGQRRSSFAKMLLSDFF